ncbi:MAG: hypothetical protein Q8905_12505, partial [Bacteroidota bacterium]|nr:hypothetical protein [Bacteroidota bacterium]
MYRSFDRKVQTILPSNKEIKKHHHRKSGLGRGPCNPGTLFNPVRTGHSRIPRQNASFFYFIFYAANFDIVTNGVPRLTIEKIRASILFRIMLIT